MPVVEKKTITPFDVIQATCKVFQIERWQLLSKNRRRKFVRARFLCMYIMRMKLKLTLAEIAAEFNRDHTTVMHALTIINNELSVSAYKNELNKSIEQVIELL